MPAPRVPFTIGFDPPVPAAAVLSTIEEDWIISVEAPLA